MINFLETHHDISDVEDVSSLHIKKFIQYQKEIGNKPNYINTIIKSLRAFYSYLVNEEYVSLNALAKIKLLKEDKIVIKTFTDKIASMWQSTLNRRFFMLIKSAGIRPVNFLSLVQG
ncbi:hypothetical protein [Peribacillus simplex]|uniref:hypothetical protein n=1 Tax=Peribacillus simplex TaxID=1478 RepID=UPI000A583DE9